MIFNRQQSREHLQIGISSTWIFFLFNCSFFCIFNEIAVSRCWQVNATLIGRQLQKDAHFRFFRIS